jgi:transcriptional regulator with XRE-family HTH domain
MSTLANNIKAIRLTKGLSQTTFGKLIGVACTSVSGYEKGTLTPSHPVMLAICTHAGVDIAELCNQRPSERMEYYITSASTIKQKRIRDNVEYTLSTSTGELRDLVLQLQHIKPILNLSEDELLLLERYRKANDTQRGNIDLFFRMMSI